MKRKNINPFICQGYEGPKYFCDREEETKKMISALYNGRNITLISPRRLGKTGLIWNTFHQIQSENKDAVCIYVDIFPTKNQHEFVNMLGSAVINTAFSKGKNFGRKVLETLAALRPVMSIDTFTGLPNVTVNVDPVQAEVSIKNIFSNLQGLEKEIFIAIDEFQQVATYPEKSTEALLRSHIQFLQNVHFVFSGSKQHMMSEMFLSPQRPFYQSTDMMNLTPLSVDRYYEFAKGFFEDKGGCLDKEVFRELYTTFGGYTWYIQSILNRMYENYHRVADAGQMRSTILSVVESKRPQYESLTHFLTDNQFAVLKAMAKEGVTKEPSGKEFLKKHKLPSASSVKTAMDVLIDKELIYKTIEGYIIYDRFLGIWLSRL